MEKERIKDELRRAKEVERMRLAQERDVRRRDLQKEKEKRAEQRRRQMEEKRRCAFFGRFSGRLDYAPPCTTGVRFKGLHRQDT